MKFKNEYETFLNAWGFDTQATMCIEEMSELTKELCKLQRHKNNPEKLKKVTENIKEEIADVLNMVEQMEMVFGVAEIEEIRQQKINRAMKKI